MYHPRLRSMHAHCVTRDDGSVWAGYRVSLTPTNHHVPDAMTRLVRTIGTALAVFTQPFQLLGVSQPQGLHDLLMRAMTGVPQRHWQSWASHIQDDVLAMHSHDVRERTYWLFARLAPPNPTRDKETLAPEVLSQAQALTVRLQALLTVQPITREQLVWLSERTLDRRLPKQATLEPGTPWALREGAPVRRSRWPLGKRARVLHVTHGETERFEATMFVQTMPGDFSAHSKAALFATMDALDVNVDITATCTPILNAHARHAIVAQQRQLAGQAKEYAGDGAGPPPHLQAAQDSLTTQLSELQANPATPELQLSIALTTWGDTLEECEQHVAIVRDQLEPEGYQLVCPSGGQVPGHSMGQPAMPAPPIAHEYRQYAMPEDLGGLLPFLDTTLGDPAGLPLGLSTPSITSHAIPKTPVFVDPARGPQVHRSASLGVFGTLGSGKSYLAKRLVLATLGRGGRVTVLDRTVTGEYVTLAKVTPSSSHIVSITQDSQWSLDPLQLMPPDQGEPVATALLSLLCKTDVHSIETALLGQAVEVLVQHQLPLRNIQEVLAGIEGTRALQLKLRLLARQPLASLLFGDKPPLQTTADYMCFHAPGLSLPDMHTDEQDMLPEHIVSRAILYVITAISRHIVMHTPGFSAQLIDEAWMLTQSAQGKALLMDAVRDGRKHNAAVWLLSQHPSDLGDDALSHLLGPRFIFNQSPGAAKQALAFMNIPPTPEAIEAVTSLPQGRCLFTDLAGRTGMVQVLPAANPEVQAALATAPVVADGVWDEPTVRQTAEVR